MIASAHMRRSVVPLIERAVLVALASAACGTQMVSQLDGGSDGGDTDVGPMADATSDAAIDAGSDGDTTADVVPFYLPLPDGCAVSGKPDAFAPCGYTETLNDPIACGVDIDADIQDANVCFVLCDPTEPDCVFYDLNDPDAGTTHLLSCGVGCVGRLHEDARKSADCCGHVRALPGDHLARSAALEAAAVDAFELVAGDLERLGAPTDLIDDARRAADDERIHARLVDNLATRFGAHPIPTPRPKGRRQDARAFAIENAIEGCVRETFGAALAAWQAARATDPRVREALGVIATDEARHANLGWRIDGWLMSVLSERDQRAVAGAREKATLELRASLDGVLPDEVLGLPDRVSAHALFDALGAIWA